MDLGIQCEVVSGSDTARIILPLNSLLNHLKVADEQLDAALI